MTAEPKGIIFDIGNEFYNTMAIMLDDLSSKEFDINSMGLLTRECLTYSKDVTIHIEKIAYVITMVSNSNEDVISDFVYYEVK